MHTESNENINGALNKEPSSRNKEITSAKNDPSSETAWTFTVPFQYAWVKARLQEVEIDPDTAHAYLESEKKLFCRVRIDESEIDGKQVISAVHAWQMIASCPFCEAGKEQILSAENWVDIHDWSETRDEEYDINEGERGYTQTHGIDLRVLQEMGFAHAMNRGFFIKAITNWGGQRSIFDSEPEEDIQNQFYNVEGYFGGLYRCPHCGGIFAVVYRDEDNPVREGRYKIWPDFDAAIDELINRSSGQETNGEAHSQEIELATDMSVEVQSRDGLVALRTNIAGNWYSLVFNTNTGTILLDGSSYQKDHFLINSVHDHPFVWSGLFTIPEFVDRLSEMLPALPRDVDWKLNKQNSWRNIDLLIAANRFVGYPAKFYEDIVSMTGSELATAYPLGIGLPRYYSDLDTLLELANVQNESVKHVLLDRPLVLLDLLNKPDLPFSNPYVLCKFFSLRDVDYFMRIINFYSRSSIGWQRLVEAKGDEAVFEYMKGHSRENDSIMYSDELLRISILFSNHNFAERDLSSVNMTSLLEDLERLL